MPEETDHDVDQQGAEHDVARRRDWLGAVLYTCCGVLVALIVETAVLLALRSNGQYLAVSPPPAAQTATARALIAPFERALRTAGATATARARVASAPTETPRPTNTSSPTATPPPTKTPLPTVTPAPSPTVLVPPSNPTSMEVAANSCTSHTIDWRWSGAHRAAGYDIVLYDPNTGVALAHNTTIEARYTQAAIPGQPVALRVRSRNDAGTGGDYFSPQDSAQALPVTLNPTTIAVTATTTTLTWTWPPSLYATGYDVVLYHYHGASVSVDEETTVLDAHFSVDPPTGVTYYLKLRALGPCNPSLYYTPGTSSEGRLLP